MIDSLPERVKNSIRKLNFLIKIQIILLFITMVFGLFTAITLSKGIPYLSGSNFINYIFFNNYVLLSHFIMGIFIFSLSFYILMVSNRVSIVFVVFGIMSTFTLGIGGISGILELLASSGKGIFTFGMLASFISSLIIYILMYLFSGREKLMKEFLLEEA
ncbi:hypothetical protein [Caldiplasma sukawensis]